MKVRVMRWGDLSSIFLSFTVFVFAISVPVPRVIVESSSSRLEVRKNSRIIIDCRFTSDVTNTSVSWTKDGQVLEPQKRVYVALNGSLIIEKLLYKPRKSRDDSGLYECFVTNDYGTFIGRQLEVQVSKPSLTISPGTTDVTEGGVARFECQINALTTRPPLCLWEHPRQTTDMNRMSNHMGILQLYNVTPDDAGEYTCRYFTSNTNQDILEKSAFLSVRSGKLPEDPTLLTTPQNLSVISGRPALLECLVEGGHHVQISWKYSNGSEIKEERGRINLSGNMNLHFTNTVSTDAGEYVCHVVHSLGSFTRTYRLDILVPPQFVVTPQEYSSNVLSAITRLTCTAKGNPTPTVSWYKDGLKLFPAPGVSMDPQLILYGRLEDKGYYQCIANNSLGISVATSWVVFERQPNTPDIVTNVTATALSSSQVNVTWSPANTPEGYPVMAYFVDYQIVHDMQCPGRCDFQTKSERDVSKQNFLVINDLKPYTKYRFAVQCLSPKGASIMSKAVTVRTKEAVPTKTPDVQIVPDSSTSFRVSWTEIPVADRHGVIDRYELSYGPREKVITVIELTGDTYNYLVTGLEPGTEYSVKVVAGNAAGYPDIDENWITYRTPESFGEDDVVPALTLEPVNSTSVSVSWINRDRASTGSYRIVIQKLLESGPVREFNVSAEHSRIIITGLQNRAFYKIDFMKRDANNTARGYVTELYQAVGPEEEMEPPPPYVLNPITQSSTEISLSWEVPKTTLHVVKYTVSYQERSGDGALSPAQFMESSSTYVYLRGLQPFTWYAIAVSSHTTTVEGPFCKPVIVQTEEGIPSPPENLLAEVVSPGKVKLKWGPPRRQNGIITYYIIYYNSNKDVPDMSWSYIHQNASTTSVVLEDLTNEIYYIKLKACTNAGKGLPSHVIMIDTSNCDRCKKCENVGSCPDKAADQVVKNRFEQTLGIIIGGAVGLVCIVICVTFVVFKQREMRARYNNRPRTELVGVFHAPASIDRFLDTDASKPVCQSTYSPLLRRMLENNGSKPETEHRALLSPDSSLSVSNQTESSVTDTEDTMPVNRSGENMHKSSTKYSNTAELPVTDTLEKSTPEVVEFTAEDHLA